MSLRSRKWWIVLVGCLLLGWGTTRHSGAQDALELHPLLMTQRSFDAPVVQVQWADETTLLIGEQSGRISTWAFSTDTLRPVWTGRGWLGGFIPTEAGFIVWRNPPYMCAQECNSEIELPDGALIAHPARLQRVALHPQGDFLLTTATDDRVRLWSLPSGTLIAVTEGTGVNGVAWREDGAALLVWDRGGTARVYAANDLQTPTLSLETAGWLADGLWRDDAVLTIGNAGHITLWRADGVLALGMRSRAALNGGELSADGRLLLTWGRLRRGVFEVWELAEGARLIQMPLNADIRGATFDPTQTHVAVWDAADQVGVWLLPNPDTCYVISIGRVNQRRAPSTSAVIEGQLQPNTTRIGVARAQGADGFVWWQLADDTWVREDVVQTTPACTNLPEPNS